MTHASPRVGVLVLDFDETLTVSDSTSVIIETAIEAAETTAKKGGYCCFQACVDDLGIYPTLTSTNLDCGLISC